MHCLIVQRQAPAGTAPGLHQQPVRRCTGEAAGKAKPVPDGKTPGAKQEFDYSHLTAQHAVPPGDWRFYGIAGMLHWCWAGQLSTGSGQQCSSWRSYLLMASCAPQSRHMQLICLCSQSHRSQEGPCLANVLTVFALPMATQNTCDDKGWQHFALHLATQ